MKYYTKEWYELMQKQNYTLGIRKVPDKSYTDEEIQGFYEHDLQKEIARDRKLHNTKPSFGWQDRLLEPDTFRPEIFLFENEETEELYHPATIEGAREVLEKQRWEAEACFAARLPFDPAETIACFEECYRMRARYAFLQYPDWVQEKVDPRLLALDRMPESVYNQLREEERKNRRAFQKIEKAAQKELSKQEIPERIQEAFHFHDANLLALRRRNSDVELVMRKDGAWSGGTPYIKVIFKRVWLCEREKGFTLRPRMGEDGEKQSNCVYLYDELYRTEKGIEVHMLLRTTKSLRYLTIGCEDIEFEDNIEFLC